MMRHLLSISACAVAILAASCSGSGQGSSDRIDTVACTGETVIPYDSLQMPYKVFATDRSIVVVNSQSVDTLIEVYGNDGSRRYACLSKGNGPGELPFIYGTVVDAGNSRLIIKADKNKQHALTGIDSGNPAIEVVANYEERVGDNSEVLGTFGMTSTMLSDDIVLVGTAGPDGLLATLSADGMLKHVVNRPPLSDFGDGLPDYMIYNFMQPTLATSPDGTHFAAIYGSADMISFGHIDGDSVVVTTDYVSAPKGIKVAVHDGYSSFEYDEDYAFNYGTLTMSGSHVYVQYYGGPAIEYEKAVKAMTEGEIAPLTHIRVYDLDGNLERVLSLDAVARSIAVTPDDSILYVLTETADDGIHVLKYDIPD